MRDEIKARIAQINAGTAPAGYKKTKVGIVPEEWDFCRLSHFLEVNKEKNTDLTYGKVDVFSISGEYGVVNQIEFLGRSYAGQSLAPYRVVYPLDIVYTKSPLKQNPYGIIKSNQTKKKGIVSALYAVYSCGSNVHAKYVEYYFGLDITLNNYLFPLVTIGPKHSMNISDENALQGFVAFPPLPEQQKIAEILTAQDAVIALMQKQIELKQQQKKALMQKLLSGEVRVGSGEWKTVRLEKIAYVIDGTHQTPQYVDKGVPFVSVENISDIYGTDKYITVEAYDQFKYKPQKNDILMTRITAGIIGETSIIQDDRPLGYYVSLALIRLKSKDMVEFVNYSINGLHFKKELNKRIIHTAFPKKINLNDIGKCELRLPPLDEQEKIAEILSAQDKEIELLQQQLALEQQKKKALMQLLLTGKVRVER